MTKSQETAVQRLRSFVERQLDTSPERGDSIVEWKVEVSPYGRVSVWAKTEMTKLPEGNLLRAVSSQHWLFFVGKRGSTRVSMAPKSFAQFKGQRAFGMNFEAA